MGKRRTGPSNAGIEITIGSEADLTKKAGDLLLLRNDLHDPVKTIGLSQATMIKIHQNLFWSYIQNIFDVPIATLDWPKQLLAGAAKALSSLSAIVNSSPLRNQSRANLDLHGNHPCCAAINYITTETTEESDACA